jgi:hypothetical protein
MWWIRVCQVLVQRIGVTRIEVVPIQALRVPAPVLHRKGLQRVGTMR